MRDAVVDLQLIAVSLVVGVITIGTSSELPSTPTSTTVLDVLLLLPASAVLWWRRSAPVALCTVLVLATSYFDSAGAPAVVALFTVASRRRARPVALLSALSLVAAVAYSLLRPDPAVSWWAAAGGVAVALLVVVGWGTAMGQRRALLESLHERAERAEAEQQLRVEQARQLERTRIAREMHDVLAHRISLISMHAGALEYRSDADPAQVAAAAGIVRQAAHQALEDLRGVLGVLRSSEVSASGTTADVEPPQPSLEDVHALVEECRRAGARVDLAVEVEPTADGPPVTLGRTAYRVAQEGLTNARKHAPGAPVHLRVGGAPGSGLEVRVRNPRGAHPAGGVPGSGTGLVGLAERVALAGGLLEHGWRDGCFELSAALPWPAA